MSYCEWCGEWCGASECDRCAEDSRYREIERQINDAYEREQQAEYERCMLDAYLADLTRETTLEEIVALDLTPAPTFEVCL